MKFNIDTWKDDFKFLFNFIERYDQDFKLDYPDEKIYWDEFTNIKSLFDVSHNYTNHTSTEIISGLISDISLLLTLPDSHPLWDVNNLKNGIFSDVVVKTVPEARTWVTSVRDYMQKKLDNLAVSQK